MITNTREEGMLHMIAAFWIVLHYQRWQQHFVDEAARRTFGLLRYLLTRGFGGARHGRRGANVIAAPRRRAAGPQAGSVGFRV